MYLQIERDGYIGSQTDGRKDGRADGRIDVWIDG